MADSVSGRDVEDMLSSVRRLVSSELPRLRRTRLPERPGALVLTEQHRVSTPLMGRNSSRKSLEDRIAELEAAVSDSAGDWEPDGSEDLAQHRPDRIVYRPSRDAAADSDAPRRRTLRLSEIALIETGPANDDDEALEAAGTPDKPASFRHEAELATAKLAARAAEEKAAAEAQAAARAAEEDAALRATAQAAAEAAEEAARRAEADAAAEEAARLAAAEAEEVARLAEAASEEVAAEVELSPDAPEEDTEAAVVAEAVAEAVTEAVAGIAGEALAADAAFDEALSNAVAASLEPSDPSEEYAAPVQDTEKNEEIQLDSAVPDPARVRAMVAAMIREELQGELGERITRNVRKLVRQEIQRALTVRELE